MSIPRETPIFVNIPECLGACLDTQYERSILNNKDIEEIIQLTSIGTILEIAFLSLPSILNPRCLKYEAKAVASNKKTGPKVKRIFKMFNITLTSSTCSVVKATIPLLTKHIPVC